MKYLAFLTLLAAWMLPAQPAGAELGRVVALGDSSASGTGLGQRLPGSPFECDRRDGGFPEVAMRDLAPSQFVNATCNGAIVSSLTTGWTFSGPGQSGDTVPAQLDALNGSERAVVLAIGDNDADFGTVTYNCLMHHENGNYDDDFCSQTYAATGVNALVARAASIGPSISGAIASIRSRSPLAEIFVVGYPRIAPPDGVGCRPNYLNLTAADAPVFADWEETTNATLASAAAASGARFVAVLAASAPHHACQPAAGRWINPLNPITPDALDGADLHPTSAGARGVADALVAAFEESGLLDEPGPTEPVEPPAQPTPVPPPATPAPAKPGLELVRLSPNRLRPTRRGPAFSTKSVRAGAVLELRSNTTEFALFRLERRDVGRKVGKKCVKRSRANARRRKCELHTAASFWWGAMLRAGRTDIHLTGRSGSKALKPGNYRVRATLSDHDSIDRTIAFKVVR